MDDIPVNINAYAPKLLDRVRATIRAEQKSYATEQTYVLWVKRFVLFHKKRHPKNMDSIEIEQYLNHLAVHRQVSPSTQKTALNAIMYLYNKVLNLEIAALSLSYAQPKSRVPVVFSHAEALRILSTIQ